MSTDPVLTARDADDHVVADDERGGAEAVAVGRVRDLDVPGYFSAHPIERDQMGVQGAHVDVRAMDGHATIVGATAEDRGAELVLVAPDLLAGVQVVRDRRVIGGGDVHHAVHHDRRILKAAQPADASLEYHPRHQAADVRRVDLCQRRIALVPIVAAVGGPVRLCRQSSATYPEEHERQTPLRTPAHEGDLHMRDEREGLTSNARGRSLHDVRRRPLPRKHRRPQLLTAGLGNKPRGISAEASPRQG